MLEVVCVNDGFTSRMGILAGQHCWIDQSSIDIDSAGVRFADIYIQDAGSFTGFRYFSTMRTHYFRPVTL